MNIKLALSTEEAAEACAVSKDVIKAAIRRGDLPAKRSGRRENGTGAGKYLIRVADLEAWLDSLEAA